MSKNRFMKRLETKLMDRDIPLKERMEILMIYEEHFTAGAEDGKTEEEIIARLGKPDEIAMEYGEDKSAAGMAIKARLKSIAGKVGAKGVKTLPMLILSSILFLIILVIWALTLGITFTGVFGIYAGVSTLVTESVQGFPYFVVHQNAEWMVLIISIGLISGGGLAGIGMYPVVRAYLGFVDTQLEA